MQRSAADSQPKLLLNPFIKIILSCLAQLVNLHTHFTTGIVIFCKRVLSWEGKGRLLATLSLLGASAAHPRVTVRFAPPAVFVTAAVLTGGRASLDDGTMSVAGTGIADAVFCYGCHAKAVVKTIHSDRPFSSWL